jgi:hypothetical protein
MGVYDRRPETPQQNPGGWALQPAGQRAWKDHDLQRARETAVAQGLRRRTAELLYARRPGILRHHGNVVSRTRLRDGELDAVAFASIETTAQHRMKDAQSSDPHGRFAETDATRPWRSP